MTLKFEGPLVTLIRITFLVYKHLINFLPFFEAEARALIEIEETGTIQVPPVITFGETGENSFLILEFMEQGSSSKAGQKQLGRELAQLHQVEKSFFANPIFLDFETMTQNKGMHLSRQLLVANYKPFVTNPIKTPCLNNLQNYTFHPESYFNLKTATNVIV